MIRDGTSLTLGRGEVYFDRFLPGYSVGEGERYLGNTPAFQIKREIERRERSTSYGGRRRALKPIVISENIEIDITTDHISTENVALWFSAQVQGVANGITLLPYTESFAVRLGRYYQLGLSKSPAGFYDVEDLSLRKGATVLTEGVDYTFEASTGRITIIPLGGTVVEHDVLTATYFRAESSFNYISPDLQDVHGALRYVSRNPHGLKTDYFFPQVRISPRGATELKGDQWQQVLFTATAVRINPNQPLLYAIRQGRAPIGITSDTTLTTADNTFVTGDNELWRNS